MKRRGQAKSGRTRRGTVSRRVAGLLSWSLVVASLAAGVTTVVSDPAMAAPAGCGYADASPNNGEFASTICWFDFAEFDATVARTTAGQPLQVELDGGLVASFTVKVTNLPNSVPMSFEKRTTPLEPRFAFGTDAYRGIPGLNALYSLGSPAGNKAATITFDDIRVVDADGRPVAGYSFVAADAEDNVRGERFEWTSDRPLVEIERLAPNGGWGCKAPVGLGTTSVSCAGTGTGGTTIPGGKSTALLVAADTPTTFATTWVTANRSAIAIGVQTSKLTVVKQVASRIAPSDSFTVTATNSAGVTVGEGTTGAGTSATTGPLVVAPGATYTASEAVAAGSTANLANYNSSWSCVNSAVDSPTVLPSGPGTSQALILSAGDDITCTVTNTAKATGLSLQKSAGGPVDVNLNGITDVGDTIDYSFTVVNTGQTDLDTVAVDDPKIGTVNCPTAVLAPSASTICLASAPYTITAADVAAGAVNNVATATAHPLGSPAAISSNTSSTSTPAVAPAPALTLVKSASPSDPDAYVEGRLITYSFVVRNTGNVPVENVTVDDVDFSGTGTLSTLSCPPGFGTLAPNAQAICTATYTLTQADVNAGALENTATAGGDPVGSPDPVVSPDSSTSIPVSSEPSISLTKRITSTSASVPGDVIEYEFDVTNTGNVSLTGASITETEFSGTGATPTPSCPSDAFIPGETVTCSASYTLTQADVNAGEVTNTATASAHAPTGPDPVSDPSTAALVIPRDPSLSLDKTAVLVGDGIAGDTVEYSFAIRNTGNITIGGLQINETAFSGTGSLDDIICDATSLDAASSTICTVTYTLTQRDVNAGQVTNTAVAAGTPADATEPIFSLPDSAAIETLSVANIALEKTVVSDPITRSGDLVDYAFRVTNTGTVDLANPAVTELAFSGSGMAPAVVCPPTVLTPDASVTCTATYAVTQSDVDAGSITNTATATATAPNGFEPPVSDPSSAEVSILPVPALSVEKSASPSAADDFIAGQVIVYSFLVTNTGNVTLEDVHVVEGEFTGTGILPEPTCAAGAASLLPGEQVVCETEYTLTQDDIDAGSLTNAASATADPPGPTPNPYAPVDEVTIPQLAAPGLILAKQTDTITVSFVGQIVDYTFTVTNTGNTNLTDLSVVEGSFSGVGALSMPICPAAADQLVPGETVICEASYVVQRGDLTGSPLVNTATASASTPGGLSIASAPSTARVSDVDDLEIGAMASTGGEMSWPFVAGAFAILAAGGVMLMIRRRAHPDSTRPASVR